MLNFGCDPEVFSSVNINGKQLVISPALMEKFCGLKFLYQDDEIKHPVYINTQEYSWMQDGAAWEITLKRPHKNPSELYYILQNSYTHLEEFLSGFKYEGMEISLYKKPVININPDWYLNYMDEIKIWQGFIFGCDPDRDAFRPDYICETLDVATHPFRYGGGHIHVSGEDSLAEYFIPATKIMAITVGNFCIANSPFPELEKQRALTYGRPGRYREQKYPDGSRGIEYRTPSNSWTTLPVEKVEELFDWVRKAVEFVKNRRGDLIMNFGDQTVQAIINADKELASRILMEIQ